MHLDEQLILVMETYYKAIKLAYPEKSDEWYRCKIVASNLKGLANSLLIGEDDPDIEINIQKIALGLLGTADWLEGDDDV